MKRKFFTSILILLVAFTLSFTSVFADTPLGSDQGIVVLKDGTPTLCSTEDFIKNYSGDSETLYTVYLIGDVVELILPLDSKTTVDSE